MRAYQAMLKSPKALDAANRSKSPWLRHHKSSVRNRLDQAFADWLDGLAPWSVAVTFTVRRSNQLGTPISQHILEDAARHFLRILNTSCFGASKARLGYTVGAAASFGWGQYGDHPHLHFSLAAPDWIGPEEFTALITKSAQRTNWINHQQRIKPYLNRGWSEYMVEHGFDNVILDLVRRSVPA